jgi:drug/metabolite transporter (DMT)-like permease
MSGVGEAAGLTAAFLWAVAVLFYGRIVKHIPPVALNLAKGAVAIVCLVVTLGAGGLLLAPMAPWAVGLLLLSGLAGIGIADTSLFHALRRLGPRRALLFMTLSPPLSALIALVFLGERLDLRAWLGIAVTVSGVAWVIAERENRSQEAGRTDRAALRRGVLFGVLASLGQSVGAVLSRTALTQSNVGAMRSALLRLLAGEVALLAYVAFARRPLRQWAGTVRAERLWRLILPAAFMGTFLAIWLQQKSFELVRTGIAQTLLATTPIFILPLAAATGERVSLRAVLGALLAVGGVVLLLGPR